MTMINLGTYSHPIPSQSHFHAQFGNNFMEQENKKEDPSFNTHIDFKSFILFQGTLPILYPES